MSAILIIGLVLLALELFTAYHVVVAPKGYEDQNGFHFDGE